MSNNNIECAQFQLDSGVFGNYLSAVAVTNQYGSCNAGKSTCTFINIPIELILGPMYAKYEKFNLVLTSMFSYMSGVGNLIGNGNIDKNSYLQIGGFGFNNTYSQINGLSQYQIIPVQMGIAQTYNFIDSPMTFDKNNKPYIDITLTYLKCIDNGAPLKGVSDWNCLYNFTIYPIHESKKHN